MTRIIGIDPGLVSTGWGILESKGSSLSFVDCGTIGTNAKDDLYARLRALSADLTRILELYKPTMAAIEETFVTQNGASTLKLGQARGALIVTLANYNLTVAEYATRKVKKALVGTGAADKHQVSQMVGVLMPASREALAACKHDAADALAIAITHAHHVR